ncbi:YraN family protein [Fibrobacterota bacterium]
MQKNRRQIGEEGEMEALKQLEKIGYRLRHKNFRTRRGEIDLVMDAPDGTLVFVEVKSDLSGGAGEPESWVTGKKIRQIQRTAQAYCAEYRMPANDMRFDVVSVNMARRQRNIRHIKNAFIPDAQSYY